MLATYAALDPRVQFLGYTMKVFAKVWTSSIQRWRLPALRHTRNRDSHRLFSHSAATSETRPEGASRPTPTS